MIQSLTPGIWYIILTLVICFVVYKCITKYPVQICEYLRSIFYEYGSPSKTALIGILSWLVFATGSLILLCKNQEWKHYDAFSMAFGLSGTGGLIANKFINSKLNSPIGEPPSANKSVQPIQPIKPTQPVQPIKPLSTQPVSTQPVQPPPPPDPIKPPTILSVS